MPKASAMTPEIIAPKAYPKSLHHLNAPMLSARWLGFVVCAMLLKKDWINQGGAYAKQSR